MPRSPRKSSRKWAPMDEAESSMMLHGGGEEEMSDLQYIQSAKTPGEAKYRQRILEMLATYKNK